MERKKSLWRRENHIGREKWELPSKRRKKNEQNASSFPYLYLSHFSLFLLFPYHFVMLSLARSHQPIYLMVHLSQIRRLKWKISHLVHKTRSCYFLADQCNDHGHNITRALHFLSCKAMQKQQAATGVPTHFTRALPQTTLRIAAGSRIQRPCSLSTRPLAFHCVISSAGSRLQRPWHRIHSAVDSFCLHFAPFSHSRHFRT